MNMSCLSNQHQLNALYLHESLRSYLICEKAKKEKKLCIVWCEVFILIQWRQESVNQRLKPDFPASKQISNLLVTVCENEDYLSAQTHKHILRKQQKILLFFQQHSGTFVTIAWIRVTEVYLAEVLPSPVFQRNFGAEKQLSSLSKTWCLVAQIVLFFS